MIVSVFFTRRRGFCPSEGEGALMEGLQCVESFTRFSVGNGWEF